MLPEEEAIRAVCDMADVAELNMGEFKRFGEEVASRFGMGWSESEWSPWQTRFDRAIDRTRLTFDRSWLEADFGPYQTVFELASEAASTIPFIAWNESASISYPGQYLRAIERSYAELPAALAEAGLPCSVIEVTLP